MTIDQQGSATAKQNKAQGSAFIRKLIIGKVILLLILAGVGYYLYLTI